MTTENIIALVIGSSILSASIGAYLMYRGFKPKSRKDIEQELKQVNSQFKQYQTQVTDHFAITATLVSNLAKEYKALHDHLSLTSIQLANLDINPTMIGNNQNHPPLPGQVSTANPPLDYAPKRGDVGTLSENYGLGDDTTKPPVTDGFVEHT